MVACSAFSERTVLLFPLPRLPDLFFKLESHRATLTLVLAPSTEGQFLQRMQMLLLWPLPADEG